MRKTRTGRKNPSCTAEPGSGGQDAPIGDLFAVGNGAEAGVESLMVRNSSDGRARNCYWPMPLRKSCKITVGDNGHTITTNEPAP